MVAKTYQHYWTIGHRNMIRGGKESDMQYKGSEMVGCVTGMGFWCENFTPTLVLTLVFFIQKKTKWRTLVCTDMTSHTQTHPKPMLNLSPLSANTLHKVTLFCILLILTQINCYWIIAISTHSSHSLGAMQEVPYWTSIRPTSDTLIRRTVGFLFWRSWSVVLCSAFVVYDMYSIS